MRGVSDALKNLPIVAVVLYQSKTVGRPCFQAIMRNLSIFGFLVLLKHSTPLNLIPEMPFFILLSHKAYSEIAVKLLDIQKIERKKNALVSAMKDLHFMVFILCCLLVFVILQAFFRTVIPQSQLINQMLIIIPLNLFLTFTSTYYNMSAIGYR